uniref:Uncharacterized protein n=1 Tax=Aegilops tauschii TaxID=37682 RepID=M8B0Y7_AEGTA
MHDETATTKTKTSIPYLPDELVSEILPRIPVEPLLRFRSVCKAWRGIIDEDSFHREHLRHQTSSLLVAPWIGENDDDGPFASSTGEVTAAGFYQWDGKQQDAATLVHAMPNYHNKMEALHSMAHCDGLVLLPADDTVHVVNPATRRTITLPPTPNAIFRGPHQAFGLGHDPRSNPYKVARLYVHRDRCTPGGDTVRMGVCTIGKGLCWRDAAVSPPPHHFMPRRTATFFKGSLLWIVKQVVPHGSPAAPSFIRFRVCVLLKKAGRWWLPKDGIRFFPPSPPFGGASSIVGGRVEVCLRRVGSFRSMLLLICGSSCSIALVLWGLSTTTFRLSTTISFVRLQ